MKSGRKRLPSEPATQYAEIDEEKLNAARREREERIYQNVGKEVKSSPIYDNVNEITV